MQLFAMLRKFNRVLVILYAGIVMFSTCYCYEEDSSMEKENVFKENTVSPYEETSGNDMENAIQDVESHAVNIKEVSDDLSPEDYEKFYDDMITAINNIHNAIKRPDNVFKFIKANGFSRVLINNLMNTQEELRTKLLMLLKDMFDTAPNTVNSLIPLNLIDKLLDIFEYDDNLAIKAHAIDILYKWLPNNPKAQVRVMKIKGFETFYKQMDKLDVGVIKTMMKLFNKILREHLDVKKDKAQVTQDDGERLVMYQRIGLLERMSTPTVCNGLLNIFGVLWSYNNNENDNIKIVLDLVKNIKPFCLKILRKKSKANEFFNQLLKFVKDDDRKVYFEKHDVNVTDFVIVIEKYLGTQKHLKAKDEF